MKEKVEVTRGSGNVFADLGVPDPEGEMLKVELALAIKYAIKERGLTQTKAAELANESQPNMSNIVGGKLSPFSIERLMRILAALGKNVTITISDPDPQQGRGKLALGDVRRST